MDGGYEPTEEIREIQYRSRKITLDDLTEDQIFICKRWATMVREVLTVMEVALPDGSQRKMKSIKDLLNEKMYSARDDFIDHFSR